MSIEKEIQKFDKEMNEIHKSWKRQDKILGIIFVFLVIIGTQIWYNNSCNLETKQICEQICNQTRN